MSRQSVTASFIKRSFDLIFATLGLLILLPLGLLIALAVKLCDFGPVFYKQTRVGRFGKPFLIWKFRSMIRNADRTGALLTQRTDQRITFVGRILRRTKLDELPQLWNVLLGDMSFVGPRPEVTRYVDRYTPAQREILRYKPGITDLASLLFRNEELLLNGAEDVEGFYIRYCLPKKIELNLQYAKDATLAQDIWIILQTLCPYWVGVLVIYAGSLTLSLWLAYELRSDFHSTPQDWVEFRRFLPLILLPQLMLLVWRGHLRGLLSYFSIPEMRHTCLALLLAFLIQLGLCFPLGQNKAALVSMLLIDLILSFFVICAVRMAFRMQREWFSRARSKDAEPARKVAIIGTGELATNLVLDFRRSRNPAREVIAFFDDNPHTWNKRPHNIPVVGMPECLLTKEWLAKIDEVIVTIPEEKVGRIKEIEAMLAELPVKVTLASGWPTLGGEVSGGN